MPALKHAAVLTVLVACTGRPVPADPLVAVHDATGAVVLAVAQEGAGHHYWDVPARRDGVVAPIADWVVERVDGALRVGDRRGIPRARVVRDGDAVLLIDAGGTPVVRAVRSGGRVTLTDRDGQLRGLVSGKANVELERAALSGLPGLGPGERAAVLVSATWP